MDELVADFAIETAEALSGLQAGLARLVADPSDKAAAADMLRRLHGLKGACAFLRLSRAEALAHAGETVLTHLSPNRSTVALVELGAMIQRMGALLDHAIRHQAEPAGDDVELLAALEAVVRYPVPKPSAAAVAVPVLPDFKAAVPAERRTPAPWAGMASFARALGDSLGKRIELQVGGDELRVAPAATAGLRTALIALVRNACDHGVETPAERRAVGKPALSIIRLSLHRSPDGVTLELSDDGRGFEPELEALAFEEGVTAAAEPTVLSGRGVGLALARREVEALQGRLQLHSVPGRGARMTITLPASVLGAPAARGRTAA